MKSTVRITSDIREKRFEHRLCDPYDDVLFFDTNNQFSNFDFIRFKLGISDDIPALHRCFSLARDAGMSTIILENIHPTGIISAEEKALKEAYPAYECRGVYRISFWKRQILTIKQWEKSSDASPIGYLILKKDYVPGAEESKTIHVFEAVFADSVICLPDSHRYNHCNTVYHVKLINRVFEIKGVIFAQQNGLSKCCAHVALYSILSMHNERNLEPCFTKMNAIIEKDTSTAAKGLMLADIKKILNAYGVQYTVYHRKKYPFHRIVYSGIESGGGSLLAFEISKCSKIKRIVRNIPFIGKLFLKKTLGHIIPCWGHVFEKDIWTPMASRHYFKSSNLQKTKYYASDNWTSHFIAHDDNFGCNLLIPRDFLHPEQIFYCIVIHNNAFGKSMAIEAEVHALTAFEDIFFSLKYHIASEIIAADGDCETTNYVDFNSGWLERIRKNIVDNNLILRTFSTTKQKYFEHLQMERDWLGNCEACETLNDLYPRIDCEHIWITEISIAQLFSSNERKLCDIIGDPRKIKMKPEEYALLVRMPGVYVLKQNGGHIFFESKLISHIKNFSNV